MTSREKKGQISSSQSLEGKEWRVDKNNRERERVIEIERERERDREREREWKRVKR